MFTVIDEIKPPFGDKISCCDSFDVLLTLFWIEIAIISSHVISTLFIQMHFTQKESGHSTNTNILSWYSYSFDAFLMNSHPQICFYGKKHLKNLSKNGQRNIIFMIDLGKVLKNLCTLNLQQAIFQLKYILAFLSIILFFILLLIRCWARKSPLMLFVHFNVFE